MQTKENNIVIFKNTKKQKDTHPDYTGTVNVAGQDFDVSLWIKEGKNGKFFAGSIKEPYKKSDAQSDDLPF